MTLQPPSSLAAVDDSLFGGASRLELLRSAAHILVVDDEEMNLVLVRAMLQRAGYKSIATLAHAHGLEQQLQAQPPDLIILDVHMPGRDGFALLKVLQPLIVGEHLPVLVITGDMTVEARHRALQLGARDFLTKPFDLTELSLRVRNQLETRLLFQDVRKQNRALIEAIQGRTQQLEESRIEMLGRLAVAAEYRDDDTGKHTMRVGDLSARLAEALGLPSGEARLMQRAATLHDVGKIGIPDALLLKPARLTDDEMAIMRTHTTIGARILGGSAAPLLQLAEVIALSHHEHWNGAGYPIGLERTAIPLPGRIVAVADAFDALTNDRPYRRALPLADALAEIRASGGTQFDPAIVAALLAIVAPEAAPV